MPDNLWSLIYMIFNAPVLILQSIFDYEILGVNLWSAFRFFIFVSCLLLVYRFLKGRS